ncbi:MAG: hypothetical protein JRJ15_16250 [Deltaproteobacteria bacterium]|nr:hypothetical protein [Deltaproteobacteria bacterium]
MEKELQSVQVVGLGQASVDYVGRVPVYPVEDSKMELERLFTSCGGPAATALVTLARLGVPTSFLGSISDDPFGIQIADSLEKERVNISFLKITPGHSSQFAFIAVTMGEGKRTIFWNRSSAPELTSKEVSLDRFSGARILHLDGLMMDADGRRNTEKRYPGPAFTGGYPDCIRATRGCSGWRRGATSEGT